MALPPVVSASSGTLTNATETPHHMHGWISGSLTWDECSSRAQCWWEPVLIVKPAAEPCSVQDLSEDSELEKGKANSPVYKVWAGGGWTENGTVKVGGIGFPAVVGQQACLEVSYKTWSSDAGCGNDGETCTGSAQYQAIVLASRPFVFEQRPVSPVPPPAPTSAPTESHMR